VDLPVRSPSLGLAAADAARPPAAGRRNQEDEQMKLTDPQRRIVLEVLRDLREACDMSYSFAIPPVITLPRHRHCYRLAEAGILGRACEKLIAELEKDDA
jgi:hypothetical protein